MLACALVCVITTVVEIRLLQAVLLICGCRQVVVEGMVLLRNHTRSAEGQKVVLLCFCHRQFGFVAVRKGIG